MTIKISKPKQLDIPNDSETIKADNALLDAFEVLEEYTSESDEPESFDETDFKFEADTVTPSIIKPTISPKDTLIKMLRESQWDEPYVIEINCSYKAAKDFIHRMRVELSRFRNKLIKLNKTLDRFSILTKSISVESENFCKITLIKTRYRRRFDTADTEVLSVLEFLEKPDNGAK